VRLIGLDRPGIGRSDPKPGYRILDWPADVAEAADQLGIERFAVTGLSGGGAYALACASKIAQRLTVCGLISTLTPVAFIRKAGPRWMRATWRMEARFPWLFRPLLRASRRLTGSDAASIEKGLLRYRARLGAADQALLGDAELRKLLVQALAESVRQGGKANVEEALVGVRPWGFQVGEIKFEKMFVWHGEQDHVMPVAPARLLAQTLPHCTATFYPDEGHFSTVANHARDILRTVSG
jgi:pimeloyl-ACP methyl ester carboxylesterase